MRLGLLCLLVIMGGQAFCVPSKLLDYLEEPGQLHNPTRAKSSFLKLMQESDPSTFSPAQRIELGHLLRDVSHDHDEVAFSWVVSGLYAPVCDGEIISYYLEIAQTLQPPITEFPLAVSADLPSFKKLILEDWAEMRHLRAQYSTASEGGAGGGKRTRENLPPLDAQQVAAYILSQFSSPRVNSLVLQKVLYYSQVCSLKMYASPLFSSAIKAFPEGPVVPEVWDKLKSTTREERRLKYKPRPEEYKAVLDSPEQKALLDSVIEELRQYNVSETSAEALSDMTHEEVWAAAKSYEVLPPEVLKDYYDRNPPIFWDKIQSKLDKKARPGTD